MIKRDSGPLPAKKQMRSPNRPMGTFAPAYLRATADSKADPATEAAFGEKKWVWIRDQKAGFILAWVTQEKDDTLHVRCVDDSDRVVKRDATDKVNPPKFDKVQDMASLTYLNEPSVAYNLQQRYEVGSIYTYSGLFLVAVNPYRSLPIYGKDSIEYFRNRARDEIAKPHVFATSDLAFRSMLEMHENQSILVTGESGAGKTENTKKVIQYLAAIASQNARSLAMPNRDNLEQQILQANPILEAFGNAQTVKNDNSSRFGKFIRIHFSEDGQITGANINWFLLEKSRVVTQTKNERNYHVFYQLLAGASREIRDVLLLDGDVHDYEYLKHSRKTIPGVSDKAMYAELIRSFETMQMSSQEQMRFFSIIAAILHIGNLDIVADRSDQARLPKLAQAEKICHLLGIQVADFVKALLTPRVKAGREWVINARSATQVKSSLAALSRSLYERNFGALVERINNSTERSGVSASSFIGVLDMAGFEIFERNSFEQLCINYTNERLQQFFNHHMFVLEQDEYAREKIDWKFIDFGLDLQPTIDLIEKSKPIGLLSCLDEECVMPKATDITFTEKLHHLWNGKSKQYRPAKFAKDGFVITHYAAEVEYLTDGWLEKNKDPMNENVSQLLAQSTNEHVANLFSDSDVEGSARIKKGLFRTVAQRHKEQLSSLMNQLQSTQPHFIRCIIPNHEKSSKKFDFALVLDQLRCNGVLEGIRIARTGFPNRLPFAEFRQRYAILARALPRGYIEGSKVTQLILEAIEMDPTYYRIGLSKVFFRAGVLADLEERREIEFRDAITQIQARARGYMARRLANKRLHRKDATMLLKHDFQAYLEMSQSPWWHLFLKMKPVLSATKSDREMKLRSAEIIRLESLATAQQQAAQKALEDTNRAEAARRQAEETLLAERNTALDKEELYQRSREREIVLQEDLDLALADVDTLDGRCDELLEMKKNLEEQMRALRESVDQGTMIAEKLQLEKADLIKRFAEVEGNLTSVSARETRLEEAKTASEMRLAQLEVDLAENKAELETLRSKHATLQNQMRSISSETSEEKNDLVKRLEKAVLEKTAAQNQLDETIRSVSMNELLIRKKDAELTEVKNALSIAKSRVDDQMASDSDQNLKLQSLAAQITQLNLEIVALKGDNKNLASQLTTVSEARAASVDTTTLDSQITELRQQLQAAQAKHVEDHASHRSELLSKSRESETYRLTVQKLEVINGDLVKQIAKSMQENGELKKEIKHIRDVKADLSSEREQLKTRLIKAESASDSVDGVSLELKKQLSEAQERLRNANAKVSQVDVEKERFRREAIDMRAKFDALTMQRANGDGTSKQLEADLASVNTKLRSLSHDYELVKEELVKSKARLDHINRLDEDLVATQVRDVTVQRDAIAEQLSQSEAGRMRVETELLDLKTSRTRFTKELEDLNHELDREHQIATAAEKMSTQLQRQLAESREHLDLEKQSKTSAQATIRRLQASLDAATLDLTERTEQVLSLYRAVSDDDDQAESPTDWQSRKPRVAASVDLAKELSLARQRLKKAESARTMLEMQLAETKKRHQELQDFDAKHQISKTRSDSIDALDVSRVPGSPTRPVTAPWTPPQTLRNGLSDPGRSRTNTLARNFENRNPLLSSEQNHLDGRSNRRIEALQNEVENLQIKLSAAQRQRDAIPLEMPATDPISISRLQRENKRLHELLDDNAEQVDAMDAAQRKDREFLRTMQTKSMAEIEETFQNLADDKIALTRAQRKSLAELEAAKKDLDGLSKTKANLQKSLLELQAELEEQIMGRNQASAIATQLEDELSDAQARSESDSLRAQELAESVKVYRERAEEYFDRLEQAESTVIKATHAENWAKKQWRETEDALSAAIKDRQTQDKFIAEIQKQNLELEAKSEDYQLEINQAELQRNRLQLELEQYRNNREQELDEREYTNEQTRKAYQRELASLSSELELERSNAIKLREDHRLVRSSLEELQGRWNEDNLNAATWEKEALRKENKIQDLMRELQNSESSQREAQSRVVSMLSDIRDLRLAKEDLESAKDEITKEKRALELKYRSLTQSLTDTTAASHTRVPSSPSRQVAIELQEKEDVIQAMSEKMLRAEATAGDAQREALQEREANVQLHKQKVALENEKKEMQLRIVDMETKSYASSAKDAKFFQSRIAELEKELQLQDRAKLEGSRNMRNTDRTIKELETSLAQREAAQKRIEEKMQKADLRSQSMQQDIEALRDSDAANQMRARRAERDAADQRERALRAEKELERYKSRDELNKISRSNTMNRLSGSLRAEQSPGMKSTYHPQR